MKRLQICTAPMPAGACRRGMSSFELLVAFSLLVGAMASTVPLYVRHQRLLAESRRERVAMEELANQAERIVAGGKAALDRLEPSETAMRRLPGVVLAYEREPSLLGERVVLMLTWDDVGRREHPLKLAVWLAEDMADQPTSPEEVRP